VEFQSVPGAKFDARQRVSVDQLHVAGQAASRLREFCDRTILSARSAGTAIFPLIPSAYSRTLSKPENSSRRVKTPVGSDRCPSGVGLRPVEQDIAHPVGVRSLNVTFLSLSFVRRAVVAAVVAVIGAAAPARADFVLDDFSLPTSPTFYSITSTDSNPYTSPTTTVAAGLDRFAVVTVISGVGPFSATGQLGGGVFEMSTPAASTATTQMNYTYATATDYAAIGATSLSIKFTFADLNTPFSVLVTDDGGNTSQITGVANVGAGTYVNSFASFTGTADFSQVKTIDVFFNQNIDTGTSTTSADIIVDEITIQNEPPAPPPAVPAPPAVLLALAAVPVLGARKLLRKA
jgi:hypothetical protein